MILLLKCIAFSFNIDNTYCCLPAVGLEANAGLAVKTWIIWCKRQKMHYMSSLTDLSTRMNLCRANHLSGA